MGFGSAIKAGIKATTEAGGKVMKKSTTVGKAAATGAGGLVLGGLTGGLIGSQNATRTTYSFNLSGDDSSRQAAEIARMMQQPNGESGGVNGSGNTVVIMIIAGVAIIAAILLLNKKGRR